MISENYLLRTEAEQYYSSKAETRNQIDQLGEEIAQDINTLE